MCRYTYMPAVGGTNCMWGVSSDYGDSGGVQYEGEQGRTGACDYEDPVVPDADTCAPTPSVAALPLPPLVRGDYADTALGVTDDGLVQDYTVCLHGVTRQQQPSPPTHTDDTDRRLTI